MGSIFKGLDVVSVGLSIFKYAAIFAAAWYAAHTWHRSQQLDDARAALAQEQAERASEARFTASVEALRTAVDDRMGQFGVDQANRLRDVNQRILANVPSDRICFGVDTVDLINSLRDVPADRAAELPDAPGLAHDAATGRVPGD